MSEGMRSIDFSNISVLVAEYNNYMRQTIRSILRTFNIGDIIEMQNPDDAWDMFCATPPDVVFADWAPGFNGMGLLQKIRRDPKSPNPFVPIIIVTSMSDKKNVLTARDLGMTEFLAKPFSPKQIFLRLRIVAEQPRAFIKTGNFFGPDRRRRNLGVQKKQTWRRQR
ncbi:MAG TPA: two-component system response regulator [Rhodobacteraceae bacterium]|nr:two-component system response regulator [Paracoccaceae bacterium]